jgi:hypothetical protein
LGFLLEKRNLFLRLAYDKAENKKPAPQRGRKRERGAQQYESGGFSQYGIFVWDFEDDFWD